MHEFRAATKFKHEDIVYIKTDPEQRPCFIIGMTFYVDGGMTYKVSYNGGELDQFEAELSHEVDIKMKTSG